MSADTVTLKVPPTANYVSLLRTTVGGFAARDHFTLDQVDDLRMAVEEAAVQLLRHIRGTELVLVLERTDSGVQVRLSADVADTGNVIDETSFSWTILNALADAVRVENSGGAAAVVLYKERVVAIEEPDAG